MIVVDASAVVETLSDGRLAEPVRAELGRADALVAPDLLFVEVASSLWRLVRAGAIHAAEARRAVDQVARLPVEVVPHRALLSLAWDLRESVRVTDSFYLACASRLDAPVLTTDARLARGHHGIATILVS